MKYFFIVNKSGDSEFSLDSYKCLIYFLGFLVD